MMSDDKILKILIPRRDLAGFFVGLAAGVIGVSTDSSGTNHRDTLLDQISDYNVTLLNESNHASSDDFTTLELEGIVDILDSYGEAIGPLQQYAFEIGKSSYDHSHAKKQKDNNYKGPPSLLGYRERGSASTGWHSITMAPKEVLEAAHQWGQDNERYPPGTRGRHHGFRWTLAHEIAHALSFKVFPGATTVEGWDEPEQDSSFLARWKEVNEEIIRNSGVETVLPGGIIAADPLSTFPHNYKKDRLYQMFADTAAYLITGSDFADSDRLFRQQLNLVQSEFDKIKIEQPTPLPPKYLRSN